MSNCGPHKLEAYSRLTPREREVLPFIARGELNKVIAADLHISMRTVQVHRANIFRKFKVRNAVQLAIRVAEAGLRF